MMARRGTISEMKTTPRRRGAVGCGAGDVKAEVDLGEAGVKGDGEADYADVVEEEADERDEAAGDCGWGRGRGRVRRQEEGRG